CFSCHAEKRGQFVWEHEPATDNCANCHSSHGSNHADMLVQKAPFLCQNCHSSQGHPAIAYDRPCINNRSESMLLGRSCMNCHGQIHGSNHPSGSTLQR
ncbi:MAG: cystathionine beta-synthase, partial [Gammaproteobacteria bacterium]|nr:cystathionine beta-synthase [Gammaproteobacteria bacterium]